MQVITIFGKICSGKSTYAEKYPNATVVNIGDIVRQITNKTQRVHDPTLDTTIIEKLNQKLEHASMVNVETFIIAGIRQVKILEAVRDFCLSKARVQLRIIHLDVPEFILKRRFANREDAKDKDLTFEDVIQRDNNLGYANIVNAIKLFPYKHYLKTVLNFSPNEMDSIQKV